MTFTDDAYEVWRQLPTAERERLAREAQNQLARDHDPCWNMEYLRCRRAQEPVGNNVGHGLALRDRVAKPAAPACSPPRDET